MSDFDLKHLITSSEILKDARTYGYYVREQIEAHGSMMPEWLIDSLVQGAALRTDLALDYLMDDCDLRLFFSDQEMVVILDSITVRNLPLLDFHRLIELLIEEGIDGPKDPE